MREHCFKLLTALFFSFGLSNQIKAECFDPPMPLLSLGGGYWHAGDHSGDLFQAEYKWDAYLWKHLRPRFTLITPGFNSLYLGVGIDYEFYLTEKIIFSPGFGPGYYIQGSGRTLGFPIEFRSSLELAYEFQNKGRIGVQAFHISNAHLCHKNPGGNAVVLFIALPMYSFYH